MVVLVVLSVVLFVAVPNFQALLEGPVERETNRLAGVLRMLRNEAVLSGTRFHLVLNLEERRYHVEAQTPDGTYEARTHPPRFREHRLPEAFTLDSVALYGEIIRPEPEQAVPIVVDASGFVDPFMLRFTVGEARYTLQVSGFTGHVSLQGGFVEPPRRALR